MKSTQTNSSPPFVSHNLISSTFFQRPLFLFSSLASMDPWLRRWTTFLPHSLIFSLCLQLSLFASPVFRYLSTVLEKMKCCVFVILKMLFNERKWIMKKKVIGRLLFIQGIESGALTPMCWLKSQTRIQPWALGKHIQWNNSCPIGADKGMDLRWQIGVNENSIYLFKKIGTRVNERIW